MPDPHLVSHHRNYKLIAIDVDGTLIDHTGNIQSEDLRALRQAQTQGATVAIASGRMGESISQVFDRIEMDGPVIGYNGAMVKLPRSEGAEIIFHRPLSPEIARSVVDFVYWFNGFAPEEDRMHLNYYLDDVLYADRQCVWSDNYHRQTGSTFHYVGDLHQFDGKSPTKTIMMSHPERREVFYDLFTYHFSDQVYLAKTWPEYHLEVMNPKANKGEALLALAAHMGIEREEIMALGDGANDIPMLELEGVFSVAMGNSSDEVKQVCDWTSRPCDEAGIAHALDSFFLIHST
ncbi:MAG: Cof-type HAD-IIB family hydrolase [Planctomycetota bacterium]|nr:Cof-type HAD-IIB family hydrolase [Planctomycetota bacterium]